MGVPTLALVLADNQAGVAESLRAGRLALTGDGAAVRADPTVITNDVDALLYDADLRRTFADNARTAIDGEGAGRVVSHLLDAPFRLRNVRPEDRRRLFDWANEPLARQMSFTQRSIPWDEHERWFAARLTDPATRIFLVLGDGDAPVGFVRFQASEDAAESPSR